MLTTYFVTTFSIRSTVVQILVMIAVIDVDVVTAASAEVEALVTAVDLL